jgi:hypothetical protein
MKDEIDLSEFGSLDDVRIYMQNYIFEYNNERPQWVNSIQKSSFIFNLTLFYLHYTFVGSVQLI